MRDPWSFVLSCYPFFSVVSVRVDFFEGIMIQRLYDCVPDLSSRCLLLPFARSKGGLVLPA